MVYLARREYTAGNCPRGAKADDMGQTLAIMFTITTYGTWLRGDARGWVDKGVVFPPDPVLEQADRARMRFPPYLLPADTWRQAGEWIGTSLAERLGLQVYALTVQPWHVHFVVGAAATPVGQVAKCAKDAVRWGLRLDRPIWGDGYDKRYCFDERSVRARVEYVERHNLAVGRPARPWEFIQAWRG